MTSHMEIIVESDRITITCGPYLTAAEVPDLQASIKENVDGGIRTIIFDFQETKSLDSSGIGLLVASHNTVGKDGGSVEVRNVTENIFHLLTVMRITKRINVVQSTGESDG
jgi:serine/threonine-protein kinase RsbW